MEKFQIEAEARDLSKTAKVLRTSGYTLGTVYGHGITPLSIQIKTPEFLSTFKKVGKTSLLNLQVAGSDYPVLIHQYHRHTLTRDFLNVEFYKVSLTEKVTATVPLKMVGLAPGIKLTGGFLFENVNEVEIECLPQDILKEIEVDVTSLVSLSDNILVGSLQVPSTVKVLTEANTLVAKIQMPQVEKVEEVTDEAAATAPELVVKKKEDEDADPAK